LARRQRAAAASSWPWPWVVPPRSASRFVRFNSVRFLNTLSLPVIPLTITVSLCLVFTFVVFFLREHARRFGNAERESLLPLAEETPQVVGRGNEPKPTGHETRTTSESRPADHLPRV